MSSDAKKEKKKKVTGNLFGATSLYALFRRTHYYTALPLAFLLLFLVFSGIMSLQDKLAPSPNPPKVLTTSCIIPDSVPMQGSQVGEYLNTLFPGKLNHGMSDESAEHIHVSIESVWRYHDIVVTKDTRECKVTIEEYPAGQALTDIHAGKHATRLQLIVFQVLGVSLGFMVLSGIALALYRKPTKRKLIAMGMLALGGLLLLFLAVNR